MELPYVDVISMSKELGKQPWEIDDERLPDLWGLSAQWLLDRGYRLYNPCPENRYDSAICEPPQATQWDFQHPYAFRAYIPSQPFDEVSFQRHLYPAQDEQGRDVVIKAVVKGSQELTIFRMLSEVPEIFDPRTFPSIIPILNILDTPHDYMFVVMPRWGQSGMAFADVGELLFFISSLLRGLSFLHEHRIAHRDIAESNHLMNFFVLNTSGSSTLHADRAKFRAKRMPLMPQYCLFDFNLSTVFPRKAPLNVCRLPRDLSWCGTPRHHPPDLKQGELDYNPFMFDVGCMGYMLLHNTHWVLPTVPLLAPLLERMIADDVDRRCTAAEALHFCEALRRNLSEQDLSTPLPPYTPGSSRTVSWDIFPLEFVEEWSHYRNPPPTYRTRLLRWIDDFEWGHTWIQLVHKVVRRLGGLNPPYIMGDWDYTK